MIEKYYAAHIKTSLDAVAINVMRPKKRKNLKEGRVEGDGGSARTGFDISD